MAGSDEINKNVERILWYIESDDSTGRKGLYQEVQDAIKLSQDNKAELDRMKTQFKVLLTVFSFITGGLGFLIKMFF